MVKVICRQDETPATVTGVATYTNRRGDTYYLHGGTTKLGKVRYFVAKTPRDGTLAAMPEGFEFSESINGVVSVRRVGSFEASIPHSDVALARTELARHPHLVHHRIDVVKGEVVVFRPLGGAGQRIRYEPVLKFVPSHERGRYHVYRMMYRGDGGWSWPLASGPLRELLQRFVARVDTDAFFELL